MEYTEAIYEFPGQLFAAHDAETPSQYAREAYDRTECGVWTRFLLRDGAEIDASDLTPQQNKIEFAARHLVGVKHGTIVEGSNAGFVADVLYFPFSDKELADTWQYLEDKVDEIE